MSSTRVRNWGSEIVTEQPLRAGARVPAYPRLRELLWAFLTGATACLMAAIAMRIRFQELWVPWGDGDLVTSYALAHAMQRSAWYTPNADLGYPGLQDFSHYPVFDLLQLVFIKALSVVVSSPIAVINIYYLLGFGLVAASSHLVMRALGVHLPVAVVLSLTFALLPWHFHRVGHLLLANYVSVCAATLAVWALARRDRWWNSGTRVSSLRMTALILCLILVGTSGLYYFAFFLGAALVAISVRLLGQSSLREVVLRFLLLSVSVLAFGLSWLATMIPRSTEALEPVVVRSPEDSLTYGGYLYTLVRPSDYLSSALARFVPRLDSFMAVTVPGEGNADFNIATVAAALFSLFVVLRLTMAGRRTRPFWGSHSVWPGLYLLAVGVFAIGSVGFVVAQVISPNIRAWGRFSVYVAFFALIMLGLFLSHWRRNGRRGPVWLAVILLAIPLAVDIGSHHYRLNTDLGAANQVEQSRYVAHAEARLDPGCPVLQLPVVAFPEMPPVQKMPDYTHLWPYIYSSQLRWSYGAMKNTTAAEWQSRLPQDVPGILAEARRAGFCGIHLDQDGYADDTVERELNELLGEPIVMSSSGRWQLFEID